jgi:hypothetical protein
MKKYLMGLLSGVLILFVLNAFSAITLNTPITMKPAISLAEVKAPKIKIKSIEWKKLGSTMNMVVEYTGSNEIDTKSFSGFSKADCRNIMNRVEARMMNYYLG